MLIKGESSNIKELHYIGEGLRDINIARLYYGDKLIWENTIFASGLLTADDLVLLSSDDYILTSKDNG